MENQALPTAVLLYISQQIAVNLKSLTATIELLDQGSTISFIARYRNEVTGNLDEAQIRTIEEKLAYLRELEARRKTVLETIDSQGKLTPELRAQIEGVLEKNELEDLYLPYKPKRRTKASIARERGLEPLAQFIWDQVEDGRELYSVAETFINPDAGVETAGGALEGARHIIAEWISEK